MNRGMAFDQFTQSSIRNLLFSRLQIPSICWAPCKLDKSALGSMYILYEY